MRNFFGRHPFIYDLVKRGVRIIFTWNIILLCIIGSFFTMGIFGAMAALGSTNSNSGPYTDSSKLPAGVTYDNVYGYGKNEILSIPITGTILGSDDGGGSLSNLLSGGQTYGYDVKDQLYAATLDDNIKGVILEIDSPGGTIYGARAIADGVSYYRAKTHRPVYAHIEGVGASGAYWAASSTDRIYADYGSEVGSIGVIMGPFEYYDNLVGQTSGLLGSGVMTQSDIQTVTITAGTSKGIGSPYRKLTTQEIQSLQQSVNNEYDGFVSYVSQHRGIPEQTIRDTIGAMIYDPQTAVSLKLINGTSSRQGTYDAIAQAAGAQGDYHVIRESSSTSLLSSLIGAISHSPQPKASFDACSLTQISLAYHGDISSWCK